jgi:ATP-dependent DNA helicase RecG
MDETLTLLSKQEIKNICAQLVIEGLEYSKVDFKSSISLNTEHEKADLLKDIAAMANTFDTRNHNHGLIVFGAKCGSFCYLQHEIDEDKFQASLDELLKSHIDPFIPVHIHIFRDEPEKTWGVLLIPPTRNAPHIFVKDGHKRNRGDIYVRRNTVTEKAMPADFGRFFRQQFEEHTFELRIEVKELKDRWP